MWAYNKHIPFIELMRKYPCSMNTSDALEQEKRIFVAECGEVLARAVNVSVNVDPQHHVHVFTAELITEPQEADMATMGGYGKGRWTATTTDRSGKVRYKNSATELIRQGQMVMYKEKKKLPVVVGSFHRDLKREINEWLKI